MKRIIASIIIIPALICCFGCQPTPLSPIVQSKNDGTLEARLYGTPAPLGKYDAPQSWKETIDTSKSDDDLLKITIDADIVIPDTKAFPVYRVSIHDFTEEDAESFTEAVFGSAELYSCDNFRTKDMVMQEILYYQNQLDDENSLFNQAIRNEDEAMREYDIASMKKRISDLEAEYKSAPAEANVEQTEIKFRHINYGKPIDMIEGYTKDGEGYIVIQKESNLVQIVYERCSDSGSLHGNSMQGMGVRSTYDNLHSIKLSYRDALSVADDYVHNTLGYTDWEMNVPFSEYYVPRGKNENEILSLPDYTKNLPQRYCFHYTLCTSDIPICFYRDGGKSQDPNEQYAPKLYQSFLTITVDDDGVYKVFLQSPLDVGTELTENAPLLSFEKIQDIFREYAPISSEYNTFHRLQEQVNDEDSSKFKIYDAVTLNVTDIRLGYIYTKEKGAGIKDGLLMPAWFFYGEQANTYYTKKSDEGKKDKLKTDNFPAEIGRCFMCINAIDGSVIDLSLGY